MSPTGWAALAMLARAVLVGACLLGIVWIGEILALRIGGLS